MTQNKKGIYIQLYNIHGLIRGHNLELGLDADTGGQTKYVLELAKSLSERDDVRKVEIMTRFIREKELSTDYSIKNEKVNDKLSIVRIRCGGSKYIRKEMLWDHLEEYVDKSIKYIKSNGELPDVIHSHYADAGYVCKELTKFFGIPFIHTGHSLGRSKLENLLKNNLTEEEIEKRYKMSMRIDTEEDVIFYSDRIITSTNQEIEEQYGKYKTASEGNYKVIPPSIDLSRFFPFNEKREWGEDFQEIRNHVRDELWKFFTNMAKPLILALCRPEKRKNISGLIEAYGRDKQLQHRANLAIFAGIRKDITKMPDIEREVLTEMLLLLDKFNLYGKMAIPKRHDVEHEVPELYRIAAETRGVFVNSAYAEPFGLTLIEAAASGLPIVATDDGGPRDIIGNLENGMLVDVQDPKNISDGITAILSDENKWRKYSNNGIDRVHRFYSWKSHTENYIKMVKEMLDETKEQPKSFISTGKRLFSFDKMVIVDIDDTLLGDDTALNEFKKLIIDNEGKFGFGVATGRTVDSARKVLAENDFVEPDIIISSVGAEIYYHNKGEYVLSTGWEAHISNQWKRDKIIELMSQFDFLEYQEEDTQRKFKASYYIDTSKITPDEVKEILDAALEENRIKANAIISHNQFVDVLPARSSKGRAIRYISYRWNIPHESIIVAGDSGNDEDMLRGELLGVVVANHSSELKKLKGRRKIYFSNKSFANGIMDGMRYYNFLEE
ncbi:MAG: HAD-IIB family hydrolase [Melioribacteraceae bacterium]|nr:HAD-IIB family hydrolase [Melioribacteraceae bacterium]MCF8354725.1 HAD-IIB family hydrolase [Melioribacteraceae bacterium]MCF8394354.1 HAD-IIB family hydrolase [Melioribacteraceae bacterium]MCF8420064.1 HAD-IIB family hydrolase [Melioribacteraceae bacterium]